MLRSRPGPQATETMGSGTGKGRVTPFLTCPLSTRAPDSISPSRKSPELPRASAQFREPLALLGDHPLFPWFPGKRAPGSLGRALRHPLALSQSPQLETRRPGWPPGPGFRRRVIRASRSPPRIRDSETLSELPPPPSSRRGATAHVSPLAQSGLSLGLSGPEDPE